MSRETLVGMVAIFMAGTYVGNEFPLPTADTEFSICQFDHLSDTYTVAMRDIHTTKSMIQAVGDDGRVHYFRTDAMSACHAPSASR